MPLSESEMQIVISVLIRDDEQVEWNGQMVDVWKEDTNNMICKKKSIVKKYIF